MINIGLTLIVLAWVYQGWFVIKGDKTIRPTFVGGYALGVLFLILGSASHVTVNNFISLNGASFALALIVLFFVIKNKQV